MRTNNCFRSLSIAAAFATVTLVTEVLATQPRANGCTGAIFTAGGSPNILINRPPPQGICIPSA